jgi:hypothetical protein
MIRIVAVSLSLLAFVGCAAPPDSNEGSAPFVVEDGETRISATRIGGGSLGGTTQATCSAIKCPDGELEGCFIPCMKGGGTTAGCTTACSCTKQTWTCGSSVYAF